jgi:hypothetical protein
MPRPKSERRSRPRIAVRQPVSIKSPRGEPIAGHTRDLSTSGIFLYADAPILEGSELEMVLMLPPQLTADEKRWVCCQATVIRVQGSGKDGPFGVAASIRSMATLPELSG